MTSYSHADMNQVCNRRDNFPVCSTRNSEQHLNKHFKRTKCLKIHQVVYIVSTCVKSQRWLGEWRFTNISHLLFREAAKKSFLNAGQSVSIPCHSQTCTKHTDLVTLKTQNWYRCEDGYQFSSQAIKCRNFFYKSFAPYTKLR